LRIPRRLGNDFGMYLPAHFREDRRDVQFELIRSHPLGLLISAGPGGLMANPVPFVAYPGEGAGVLRAHVARANPQWRELSAAAECLVVFQGPQAYISPTLYPTKAETHKVVPTWNYATVHVWGRPQVFEDAGWLRRQIDDLTQSREGARPDPWQVADAPADFIAAQLKAIVGIEIAITRIEAKWKMSQNRNAADRQGVAAGLRAEGGAEQAAVARLVDERGQPAS
jgi:transcriptional regulator